MVAAGAAIAIGELLAGIVSGIPSPIAAIGRLVIDLQPPGAKEFVVGLFGTDDKLALQVLIVVVTLAAGAGVGLLGRTRPSLAMALIGLFAAVGFVAGFRDPATNPTLAVVGAFAGFTVGTTVLDRLLGMARRTGTLASTASMPDWGRRRLLIAGGGVAFASVVAGGVGRLLVDRRRSAAPGALPPTTDPVSLPAGADLGIDGLTPIVVPTADFYRIDTALIVPSIDRDTWRLRIHGMVEREVVLSYADLLNLQIVEQYVTIACVSNLVGGDLVGNAKWTGVRLRDVLDLAAVKPGATQLVGRSADGWTAGSPTAWVMDPEREPMIALGMNGAPLPPEHGFPARVIIPGLYGYVSATKWVTELELTTLEAFDAYWVPLGWAKEAPILTQSRIDRPGSGETIPAGGFTFAGVAWAPDRGITKVEVQLDDALWQEAILSVPISDATWVQWKLDGTPGAGDHRLRVRATDRTGETQTEVVTRPDPNGARGWHAIRFAAH
jgi:DMSO/TMAO reductase YedYZ molybdopterin-dependent catalytic subunit